MGPQSERSVAPVSFFLEFVHFRTIWAASGASGDWNVMFSPSPGSRGPSGLMQLAGMGVELAAAVLVFCAIGYWIDRHWPSVEPWGLVICSILGIVGGLYNLIRKALHESLGIKPPDKQGLSRDGSADRSGDKPSNSAPPR